MTCPFILDQFLTTTNLRAPCPHPTPTTLATTYGQSLETTDPLKLQRLGQFFLKLIKKQAIDKKKFPFILIFLIIKFKPQTFIYPLYY